LGKWNFRLVQLHALKIVRLMKQFRPRFGRTAQTVPRDGYLGHS
jgi:hypothetical protein